jgi:hypothetical protein
MNEYRFLIRVFESKTSVRNKLIDIYLNADSYEEAKSYIENLLINSVWEIVQGEVVYQED